MLPPNINLLLAGTKNKKFSALEVWSVGKKHAEPIYKYEIE
jgi:hypothetical protein